MTLWQINMFICLADLSFMFLGQQKANYLMRRRYPELHFLKTHWTTRLVNILKAVVVSLCPGFNLLILYILITKDNQLVEEVIADAQKKYADPQKQEEEQLKQSIADTVTKIKEEQDNV